MMWFIHLTLSCLCLSDKCHSLKPTNVSDLHSFFVFIPHLPVWNSNSNFQFSLLPLLLSISCQIRSPSPTAVKQKQNKPSTAKQKVGKEGGITWTFAPMLWSENKFTLDANVDRHKSGKRKLLKGVVRKCRKAASWKRMHEQEKYCQRSINWRQNKWRK